jgi:flagellar biosynthesis/type III secretory pathway protein FliH
MKTNDQFSKDTKGTIVEEVWGTLDYYSLPEDEQVRIEREMKRRADKANILATRKKYTKEMRIRLEEQKAKWKEEEEQLEQVEAWLEREDARQKEEVERFQTKEAYLKEGLKEARKKGFAKGYDEAKEKGYTDDFAQNFTENYANIFQEGFTSGFREGYSEGFAQVYKEDFAKDYAVGLVTGRREVQLIVIRNLLRLELPLSDIAQITDLPVKAVEEFMKS